MTLARVSRILSVTVVAVFIMLATGVMLVYPSDLLSDRDVFVAWAVHVSVVLSIVSGGIYVATVVRHRPPNQSVLMSRRALRASMYSTAVLLLLLHYISAVCRFRMHLPVLDMAVLGVIWVSLSYHYLFCATSDDLVAAKRVSYTCWFSILLLASMFAISTALAPDESVSRSSPGRWSLVGVFMLLIAIAVYPLRKLHMHDIEIRKNADRLEATMNRFRLVSIPVALLAVAAYLISIATMKTADWIYKLHRGWLVVPFMVGLIIFGEISLPRPAVGNRTLRILFWVFTGYLMVLILLFLLPRTIWPHLGMLMKEHAYILSVVHGLGIIVGFLILGFRLLAFVGARRTRE